MQNNLFLLNRYAYLLVTVLLFSSFVAHGDIKDQSHEPNNSLIQARSSHNLPVLTFHIGDQTGNEMSVAESLGNFSINATLSGRPTEDVTFTYQYTGAGQATHQSDFSLPGDDITGNATGGNVIIPAGQLGISIPVSIRQDNIKENDEAFILQIFNISGAVYEADSPLISITIIDDEDFPLLVLTSENATLNDDGSLDIAIDEGSAGIPIKIELRSTNPGESLNTQSSQPIAVSYTVEYTEEVVPPEAANLDTSFADFEYPSEDPGILIIEPLVESHSFNFIIVPDEIPENQESITFTLTDADNANIHNSRNTITIAINDDDSATGAINPSGVTNCYDGNKTIVSLCDDLDFPGQDGESGSDNLLVKMKYDGTAKTLTAVAEDSLDYDCIYDQNTELLWQAKKRLASDELGGGIVKDAYIYSWYNQIGRVNGGSVGSEGTSRSDGSGSSLICDTDPCNTSAYAQDTNNAAIAVCGHRNWRLPRVKELLSIMDLEPPNDENGNPSELMVDQTFFGFTSQGFYWTSTPASVYAEFAWCVYFGVSRINHIQQCMKSSNRHVRLVATYNPDDIK